MAILPELAVLTAALMFFCLSLCKDLSEKLIHSLAVGSSAVVLGATIISYHSAAMMFYDSYAVDLYSQFFKMLIALTLIGLTLGSGYLKAVDKSVQPEYYMFLFLSVLGLMMLVSSVELIAIFIALELSSFALYVLVPMREDRTGIRFQMEAGIKYILFGVMATGFMLYGMSYLFGLTGTTSLAQIVPALAEMSFTPAMLVAVLLILCGFLYKLAAFPLHFWVPDVYQGASNSTTAFIATAPKLAAVALLIRMLTIPSGVPELISAVFAGVAICSIFYGNLCALVQKDVKRMLGFSGIAHAGFVLLALLVLEADGYALALYYIAGYVFMSLACFLVVCNVSRKGENVEVADLAGLYQRQPTLALVLTIALFGLAGIPPFVGFMGKFFILTAAYTAGFKVVVVLAAINTALAIYYYLSIVKVAYTEDLPEAKTSLRKDEEPAGTACDTSCCCCASFGARVTGIVLVLLIVLMGILPSQVLTYTGYVVQTIL